MERRTPIFKVFLMSILFINLFIISSYAQQTKKISLQGFLKDGNGKAVADGNQEIIFKLYPSETGGTVEWEETQTINVFGGVYSTHLGSDTNPLDNLNWGAKTYFVGVTVQGSELNPRTELTFAPYSLGSPKAQEVVCSGAVGDIKYSILPPDQFAQVNGDCWVPMDGRALTQGTKLRTISGRTTLPDGSGTFLRSQEFDGKADRDPSRTSASSIATIQTEDLKSHNHGHNISVITNIANAGEHHHYFHVGKNSFQDGDGRQVVEHAGTESNDVSGGDASLINTSQTGNHSHNATSTVNGSISPTGGLETRPTNLNFWIYIRIN